MGARSVGGSVKMRKELGKHLIVEVEGCDPKKLDDMKFVEEVLVAACEKAKATMVSKAFHKFNPQGVTGIILLAESHISVHTWPEHRYAAIDIFTCGSTADPWAALEYIKEKLNAKKMSVIELRRGLT